LAKQGKAAHGAGFPRADLIAGMMIMVAAPVAADRWVQTLGVSVAAPLALVLAASSCALALVYARYFGLLGASDARAGSWDRRGYDDLRERLATGGLATHLYAEWLTAFLDRADRFFGDAGMADRTLFPHAFGLRTPAPLWTAPAFDRCLLLALIYPLTMVFIMWAVSGHVGPAEEALGLARDVPGWKRGAAATAIGFSAFAWWRFTRSLGWRALLWGAGAFTGAFVGVFAGADVFAGTFAGAFVGASAFAGAFVGAGSFVGAGAVAVAFAVAFAFAGAFAVAFEGAVVGAGAGAVAAAVVVVLLNESAIRNRRQGVFLLSFLITMTAGCLIGAHFLATFPRWNQTIGPLLLFFGLLTLLNSPFDWVSLGLTRALLRRGLERKGWWPFFLATADALAAAGIIAMLAIIMVIGVQAFDDLAVHGGGTAVLPLISGTIASGFAPGRIPLLDGIAAHPEAPEYWWVYALLLSTMIPSLINLAVGGTALVRAVPGLPQVLLRCLPATRSVPAYDRTWIAAVLTLQAALGVTLGIAVQALVAWGLIFHAMPAAGLGLLDLARGLAALDLPARVIAFFVGA
jgi:hypothetical protein